MHPDTSISGSARSISPFPQLYFNITTAAAHSSLWHETGRFFLLSSSHSPIKYVKLWLSFFPVVWVTHLTLLSLRDGVEFSMHQAAEEWIILCCNQSFLIRRIQRLKTISENFDFTKTSGKKPDHNRRSGKDKDSTKLWLGFNQK